MPVASWTRCASGLEEFALSLHPDKTRLIEFGRYAAAEREQRGLGKPETFNFLGFTFICGKSRRGSFLLKRKTRRDRMRAKLREIKEELRRRDASADPRTGEMAEAGRHRLLRLPRRADQQPRRCRRSATMSSTSGDARSGGAARRTGPTWERIGEAGRRLAPQAAHPSSLAERSASPSNTRGGSRMRECRTYGSVRGALSNGRPYRDPDPL